MAVSNKSSINLLRARGKTRPLCGHVFETAMLMWHAVNRLCSWKVGRDIDTPHSRFLHQDKTRNTGLWSWLPDTQIANAPLPIILWTLKKKKKKWEQFLCFKIYQWNTSHMFSSTNMWVAVAEAREKLLSLGTETRQICRTSGMGKRDKRSKVDTCVPALRRPRQEGQLRPRVQGHLGQHRDH